MPISIFFSIIIEYNNEKNYNNESVIKIFGLFQEEHGKSKDLNILEPKDHYHQRQ